jgi:hypothetical protein
MSELAKINGYDIRDKKLADEGTVTTASSSDYVLLEDTNGNYQKIAKNSFTEAVRNTLGDLLRTNDKGTSITGVPALSGSGTSESPYDFGSISTANLASVLGGNIPHIYIDDTNDLNDYRETKGYYVWDQKMPRNTPANITYGIMIVLFNLGGSSSNASCV